MRLRLTPVLAALLAAVTSLAAAGSCSAQGLLVNVNADQAVWLPRPPIIIVPPSPTPPLQPAASYKIKQLEVNGTIEQQIARIQVSQTFVNTGNQTMEVCFVFPLPYDGAIDQLTLLVDGKEFPAKLLDAKEARKLYEETVRKNKDPALLEWMGAGLFRTSVFPVPAGAERKVTLRYSQLCRKWDGLTDFIFPLSTAKYTSQPVEEVAVRLTIKSDVAIKNVYSPNHTVDIKRPDEKQAVVSYTAKNAVPTEDFRLFYDVGRGPLGATVLSYRPKGDEDGFFLLLASPQIAAATGEPAAKTVVLVVDRSGSMSGEKVNQAKNAAKFVINNLREGDLFNIIAYDSEVESWRPELQKLTDDTRKAAAGFVEGLFAGGSTNINAALTTALGQLNDSSRPSFVIFLTDGLPTVGETNEAKIVANALSSNKVRARIFDFGVGYDVNSRLLDKLARENFGLSQYVRPNEDIERAVAALYNRIGSPVLTGARISVDLEGLKPEDGSAANRVYPKDVVDLFAGEQLVLVGRYKKAGAAKIKITGTVGGSEQSFDFPATFVETSGDQSQSFIEKLWAVRRVGEILDEIDLKGRNDELVNELVALSLKHGIMTPYTSFLADEEKSSRDARVNLSRAHQRLETLSDQVAGQSGFNQRVAKEFYRTADLAASPAGGYGAGAASAPAAAYDAVPGARSEAEKAAASVRHVGSKTFYRREARWVDSTVTAEQERRVTRVARYSDEFFRLIDAHGREAAKYLSLDEPLTVEIAGTVYSIE